MSDRHSASWARIEVVQRSKGQSAVARAAYHLAARLYDERRDQHHDFSKRGGVETVGVFGWRNRDPQDLWNAAENAEKKRDGTYREKAQTAREMRIALPVEIPDKDLRKLLRGYAMWMHERYGVAVQIAVHQPPRDDSKNLHVHILMTTRTVDPNSPTGLGKKARELDDRTSPGIDKNGKPLPSRGSQEVNAMRDEWTRRVNRALKKCGSDRGQVDLRSHKERAAVGDAPPKRLAKHLGPAKAATARKYFKECAAAKAYGTSEPDAPGWIKSARRNSDINRQLQSLWDETLFQSLRHRKRGEEEQAEELLGILFGAVSAFFTRSQKPKDRQTVAPSACAPLPLARPDPEAEERALIASEFDVEVDPEADPKIDKKPEQLPAFRPVKLPGRQRQRQRTRAGG
ncbi:MULTISPECIES: MobA/MobL family protein [unclassified Sulfitobacter]|uniref:MobA/MobL family protein n=1 Tax=unclassified Sulfitobacter TaxID=196795 RepID=UPI00068D2E50|nr:MULTISPECIES: MobA/MobL family protein [unclassified Sulfitobacter]PTA98888.1 hypothetical protein C8254_10480 [Sulfitobacter sp. CB-A]ULO18994.1 MobA/MobL family protein [Sulfitobacter sp. CB2047]